MPGTGAPELIITTGEDEKLLGKAAYVLRTGDGALDLDKVRLSSGCCHARHSVCREPP